jgi:signal transduction histidine kinase
MPVFSPHAARADRHGGRQRGEPARNPAGKGGLRRRVWSIVLWPLAVTVVAAVACVSVLQYGSATGETRRIVAAVAAVCVAGVFILAGRQAARVARVVDGLRRSETDGALQGQMAGQFAGQWVQRFEAVTAEGHKDILSLLELIGRGERPLPQETLPPAVRRGDPFADFEQTLRLYHQEALGAVAQAAARQQVDVFVNIAQRLHALVNRALARLDSLESEVEDPDLLGGLFGVDHLVTQFRRQVESLAVMGGAVPRRISKPVPLPTVLRQAVAEIEQYARVRVVQPPEGTLPGYAAAEVIHLLAELVENAAKFSPPEAQVTVRAEQVPAGLAIEIDDRGLPMPPEKLGRMNQLLVNPDQFDIRQQLEDGRIGLFVVAQIARRHGIEITLRKNIYGGNQAVVVLPTALIAAADGEAARQHGDTGRKDGAIPGRQPAVRGAAPAAPAPAPVKIPQATLLPAPGPLPIETVPGRTDAASGRTATMPARMEAVPGRTEVAPVAATGAAGRNLPKRRNSPHGSVPQVPGADMARPAEVPPEAEDEPVTGGRPTLPKRSETYRAPEFSGPADTSERQAVAPNPDLMARFTSGIRLASTDDGTSDRPERTS